MEQLGLGRERDLVGQWDLPKHQPLNNLPHLLVREPLSNQNGSHLGNLNRADAGSIQVRGLLYSVYARFIIKGAEASNT